MPGFTIYSAATPGIVSKLHVITPVAFGVDVRERSDALYPAIYMPYKRQSEYRTMLIFLILVIIERYRKKFNVSSPEIPYFMGWKVV